MFEDPLDKLEEDFRAPYQAWKQSPTPETMDQLLTTINPVVNKAITQFAGAAPGPNIRSKAKKLTIEAIKTYDPSKAQLNTHLLTRLQALRRLKAQEQQIIKVPERVTLDRQRLYEAENELRDRLNRDPSDEELADHSGLSTRRIQHVRTVKPVVPEGVLLRPGERDEDTGYSPPIEAPNSGLKDPWLDFVYSDLSPTDQLIMEHTIGLHGKKILSNQEVAKKLKISPAAISQRKLRIQDMLNRQDELQVF